MMVSKDLILCVFVIMNKFYKQPYPFILNSVSLNALGFDEEDELSSFVQNNEYRLLCFDSCVFFMTSPGPFLVTWFNPSMNKKSHTQ